MSNKVKEKCKLIILLCLTIRLIFIVIESHFFLLLGESVMKFLYRQIQKILGVVDLKFTDVYG